MKLSPISKILKTSDQKVWWERSLFSKLFILGIGTRPETSLATWMCLALSYLLTPWLISQMGKGAVLQEETILAGISSAFNSILWRGCWGLSKYWGSLSDGKPFFHITSHNIYDLVEMHGLLPQIKECSSTVNTIKSWGRCLDNMGFQNHERPCNAWVLVTRCSILDCIHWWRQWRKLGWLLH